jgi:hypothetical protein
MQFGQSPDKNTRYVRHGKITAQAESARGLQQRFQYHPGFHARQPGADTEVNPVAETQVFTDVPAR